MSNENRQTDFDRDVALCDQHIKDLEAAIREGGDSFSASGHKEFATCWKMYRKAKPGSSAQRKAEERLNGLAESRNIEDLRAQLRRWIEQRRRLFDTRLKAEASAARGQRKGSWIDLGDPDD